jgi:hypothetical protein
MITPREPAERFYSLQDVLENRQELIARRRQAEYHRRWSGIWRELPRTQITRGKFCQMRASWRGGGKSSWA